MTFLENNIKRLIFKALPLGPRVDFTRSPTAMAPINEDNRAVSAFSSSASALRIRTGFNDTCKSILTV